MLKAKIEWLTDDNQEEMEVGIFKKIPEIGEKFEVLIQRKKVNFITDFGKVKDINGLGKIVNILTDTGTYCITILAYTVPKLTNEAENNILLFKKPTKGVSRAAYNDLMETIKKLKASDPV